MNASKSCNLKIWGLQEVSRVREKAKCAIIIVNKKGWPSKALTSNDRVLWEVKSVLVLVIAACKGSLILD